MHSVNLIAKALRHNPDDPDLVNVFDGITNDGICSLTGEKCECLPKKDLFGVSFNNIDCLAYPSNDTVGIDAYMAMKYKWERCSSFFCDGENFVRLNRQGVRDMVLKSDMPPEWIGYATTSYKKHGALVTKVNTGKKRFWAFEQRLVDMTDFDKTIEWWDVLNIAIRAGISRGVMEHLTCPPFVIKKIGLLTWLNFEKWAKDKYLSSRYSFLCYLLPSQQELKDEKKEMKK